MLICSLVTVGAARGSPAPPSKDEIAVQAALGLFLALPDRREAGERVVRRQQGIEIWYLRPVSRGTRADALCDGMRWLVAGRLTSAPGANDLFARLPGIDELTLVFYDLETSVEPDARGRYRQARNARPQARFTLRRGTAAKLQPAPARVALQGGGCVAAGRQMLDEVWTP
mgnify:CR=1 FL=1